MRFSRFAIGNQRSHPRLVGFLFGPFNIAIVVLSHRCQVSTCSVEVKLYRFQMRLSCRFDVSVSLQATLSSPDSPVHPTFVRAIRDTPTQLITGTFFYWI
jgi:hypothetical protein